MSVAQVETFSPKNITVLGGLLLLAIVLDEVVFRHASDQGVMAEPDTVEVIAMRLKPVVSLDTMRENVAMASAAGSMTDKSPDQLYQGACLACHTTGAAGAPGIGDSGAWKTRLATGLDSLVTSAISGVGAMPPRGGPQYNDNQIRAVIEYILAESK